MIWLLIIGAVVLAFWLYFKFFKVPKMNALVMVTGGVKAGKSTFAVASCIQQHKSRVRVTKVKNWFRKLFKKPLLELPLLYSNIPLNYPYVSLTRDLIERKERFVYGSVIYCGEASLVSNSMNFKNIERNERILLFNKLIGHELRGGLIIYDTQCIGDLHYGIKRSISQQFHVHHTRKCFFLPFIMVYVREMVYVDGDNSNIVNNIDSDIEDSLKCVLIWKSVWKKFDAYCYSSFTDDLQVNKKVVNKKVEDLRVKGTILSFNTYSTLYNQSEVHSEKKDN